MSVPECPPSSSVYGDGGEQGAQRGRRKAVESAVARGSPELLQRALGATLCQARVSRQHGFRRGHHALHNALCAMQAATAADDADAAIHLCDLLSAPAFWAAYHEHAHAPGLQLTTSPRCHEMVPIEACAGGRALRCWYLLSCSPPHSALRTHASTCLCGWVSR